MACAPGVNKITGSCISTNLLEKMYIHLNAKTKKLGDIGLLKSGGNINIITYRKKLILSINNLLQDQCTSEICWIGLKIFKDMNKTDYINLTENTFKPKGPQDKTWLDTNNINQVMKQYENKELKFKFLGAVPRDFDQLPGIDFSNFNYDELIKQGKTKIGIIFNHDKHDQGGSHWVALYFDLENGDIFYSDSVGYPPKKEIRELMNRINTINEKRNIKSNIKINKTQHQEKDSECGVYSIAFIIRLLDGENVDDIMENKISDDTMNEFRKVIFNKNQK